MYTEVHSAGITTSTTLLQGGARAGTEWTTAYNVRVQPVITGLLYSNVDVSQVGGAITDEGQLWGKINGKLNFVFSERSSAYVEAEARGTSGDVETSGYAVRIGVRQIW